MSEGNGKQADQNRLTCTRAAIYPETCGGKWEKTQIKDDGYDLLRTSEKPAKEYCPGYRRPKTA